MQWTDAAAPAVADWRPSIALGDGTWALDGAAAAPVGIRYRLVSTAAWSPVSEDRKLTGTPDAGPVLPVALTAPTLVWRAVYPKVCHCCADFPGTGAVGRVSCGQRALPHSPFSRLPLPPFL
jgi:hypothetical protein